MAWKDNLRPASFKGAGFFVETSERAGGRLGTTYQYPSPSRGQNDADEGRPSFFEDLGRQPRAFSLDGYVVGDDYMSARDTLLAALESRGAGTLVHPYFGSAVVAAKSFRVRESSADGRMARFSIDFEETPGEPTQPSATADTKGQLQVAATAARTVAADSFTATYKPGTYMDRVAAILADTATALRSKILQTVTDVQAAAALNGQISSLTSDAAALAATPSALLAALGDILTTVTTSVAALLSLAESPPGRRPVFPPSLYPLRGEDLVEATNFDALQNCVVQLVVCRAAELALAESFASYDEAKGIRNRLTKLLDDQIEKAADDSYGPLEELRAAVVDGVPAPDSNLPRLMQWIVPSTMSALEIVWRLYRLRGLTRLEDVITRNRIRNPLIVAGGTVLTVLSDA